MSGQRHYAGAIWTNHALQRLFDRDFTQAMAGEAFMHPDQTHPGRERDSMEYKKRFGTHTVTVIAKKTERNEWLIVSCWITPPLPGTADEKKRKNYIEYRRASFWRKFWLVIKRQLGLTQW